jgi:filamentous hemagglutinin
MVGSLNGDTTISTSGNYKQVGSSVLSGSADENGKFVATGDTAIVAKKIDIEAGYDTYNGQNITKSKQSGLTVALTGGVANAITATQGVASSLKDTGKSKNDKVNAMALANTAMDAYKAVEAVNSAISDPSVGVSLTFGSSKSKSTTDYDGTNAVSSSIAGKIVTLKATGDKDNSSINIVGSNVAGANSTNLQADHDVNILSATNTDNQHSKNKSSGWNAGVAVDSNGAIGVTVGGNVGKGKSDGVGLTHTNSHVGMAGSRTNITAGDTTNIKGGQVLGDQVTLNTKNLNIQSLQDKATYDSKQMNASGQLTIGAGASGSASYSQSKINSDYASVGEQSGILAGNDGYNINVSNATNLIGGIITSSQKAVDEGKNSLSTSTLTSSDINNYSHYKGSSFGITAGGSYSNPNAPTNSQTASSNESGKLGLSKSIGYGSDSDHQATTTKSGINTTNITIKDTTNSNITKDAIHTKTTTEQVEANSGRLANIFDASAVQNELDISVRVTQAFDANRQEVKSIINSKADKATKAKEEAEATLKNDPTNQEALATYTKAQETIKDMQQVGLLVDMVNGALYSPADNALGTVANTLSPKIVYEIGQHFKENEELNKRDKGDRDEQGSTRHLLAQALVAGVTAGLAGNDILSSTISGGGGEAIAPYLAEYIYGVNPKDVSKMTAEQKQTISAIISLGSTAIGATSGSVTDMVASGEAGRVAVEENRLLHPILSRLMYNPKPLTPKAKKMMINALSMGADFTPVVGDIKGFAEAESFGDYIFATIGVAPILGDAVKKSHEAYVIAKANGDLEKMKQAIMSAVNTVDLYRKTYKIEFTHNPNVISMNGVGAVKVKIVKKELVLPPVKDYNQARNQAMDILGDLGSNSKPFIGSLKTSSSYGKVAGRQSSDGLKRWRLDYDPEKGLHINIEDFSKGKSKTGAGIKQVIPIKNGTEIDYQNLLRHLNK